jgi:hypothetical protein
VSQSTVPPSGTVRGPARGNARATVRYRCAPATLGRVYLTDDHEFQHGWLIDLSATGVGMALARPIPVGTDAVIQIRGADGRRVYDLPARIVHCTEQVQHDWIVGCVFDTPLSPDDLDNLL